ncbi:uncharacterized protein [Blastocystis hominis]|uniref:RING-type domain-containing protein n=1 Tax=Blastocystis hominis TaxID=12968 RepID=D8M837_BLAHO|nr:uncharacterized protein [Blastocystis hominis]CBK24226.2 unnamed protein product [Blastocystis hominis]|eukprot:XP_012898274.1 uncharacterized protein [Blastocystis hominis]
MVLGYGMVQYHFSSKMINKRVNEKVKRRIMTIPSSYYDVSIKETLCSICLAEFCKGEKVSMLPCGHVFHYQCIVPWLGKQSKELGEIAHDKEIRMEFGESFGGR